MIVYRPSYLQNIKSDIFCERANGSDTESKLNGSYPIVSVAPNNLPTSFLNSSLSTYIQSSGVLPSDARNNPDKYILPLDIVVRQMDIFVLFHYSIYLGNEWVAHLPGEGEPTQFDTWYNFCNPSAGSSGSSRSFFSSNSRSGSREITWLRPQIPFKRKSEIIRHIAKTISYKYGKHSYDKASNNCEHLVKRCIFGLNDSQQVEMFFGLQSIMLKEERDKILGISSLAKKIEHENEKLDNLTSCYSYEKERIERYIREAENNHFYTRYRYQIEQEKFQERIVVYPKDWCRIS